MCDSYSDNKKVFMQNDLKNEGSAQYCTRRTYATPHSSAAIVSRLNFLNKRYYSSNGAVRSAKTIHNTRNSNVKGKKIGTFRFAALNTPNLLKTLFIA